MNSEVTAGDVENIKKCWKCEGIVDDKEYVSLILKHNGFTVIVILSSSNHSLIEDKVFPASTRVITRQRISIVKHGIFI